MTRRPDLFLIGAPKCGTTSIYEYLRGHPEIHMSPRKEPQYFDFDPARRTRMRYGDDLDAYLSLFESAGDATRVGEASTSYLCSPVAPERMREFQPEPYLVVALRNPVKMLHALHGERVAAGVEPLEDFVAALADEPARRAGERGEELRGIVYRPWARFGVQLERWFEEFGRERVHVIILEDFVDRPEEEFRRLLEFLEVKPDYQPQGFVRHNPSHRPRSRLLSRVLNAQRPRQIARGVIPLRVRNRTTLPLGRFIRRVNTRRARRPALDPQMRTQLMTELRPDVRRVSELLGADMAQRWWGRPLDRRPSA